jgi:TonB family protein
VQQPTFIPQVAPRLANVPTTVMDLPIPAQTELKHTAAPTVVVAETPQVIINPKPITRTIPGYPERAEDRQIEGYVDFDFTIEPDGSVGNPKVVAEVPEGYGFANSAQKAFPQWKFAPKLINGKPTSAPAKIRVSFRLAKN